MILKKSYWAKWLENNRRRSWTFLLCLVMALFCGPLYLMVVLTGLQNNYANDSVYNAAQAAESLRELIQSRITDVIGFSFIHVLFAAFFAILFAVQGFCWLYSRRKTDLYFSVPESLKKRYMLICGNGILVYSFSTLTALLLDWIIGAAFHGMTGILAAQSLLAWFVEQLAFIAMYQVALVAVMLTGNILTALLGCAVFFSYELAVRFLIDELKTMFFASYCSADARQWMQKSYLTPFAGFWDLLNHIWYRDEGQLCSYKNAGGMFLQGSSAQEESLCHASFLYNVLSEFKDYYAWNDKHKNRALYENRALYSPDVVFTNDSVGTLCDVITCAAPNKSAAQKYCHVSDEENYNALESRIRFVLHIAEKEKVDTLILGAYGAGVFGQDATEVAQIFKRLLIEEFWTFEKIIFAIPDCSRNKNYKKFLDVMSDTIM